MTVGQLKDKSDRDPRTRCQQLDILMWRTICTRIYSYNMRPKSMDRLDNWSYSLWIRRLYCTVHICFHFIKSHTTKHWSHVWGVLLPRILNLQLCLSWKQHFSAVHHNFSTLFYRNKFPFLFKIKLKIFCGALVFSVLNFVRCKGLPFMILTTERFSNIYCVHRWTMTTKWI